MTIKIWIIIKNFFTLCLGVFYYGLVSIHPIFESPRAARFIIFALFFVILIILSLLFFRAGCGLVQEGFTTYCGAERTLARRLAQVVLKCGIFLPIFFVPFALRKIVDIYFNPFFGFIFAIFAWKFFIVFFREAFVCARDSEKFSKKPLFIYFTAILEKAGDRHASFWLCITAGVLYATFFISTFLAGSRAGITLIVGAVLSIFVALMHALRALRHSGVFNYIQGDRGGFIKPPAYPGFTRPFVTEWFGLPAERALADLKCKCIFAVTTVIEIAFFGWLAEHVIPYLLPTVPRPPRPNPVLASHVSVLSGSLNLPQPRTVPSLFWELQASHRFVYRNPGRRC